MQVKLGWAQGKSTDLKSIGICLSLVVFITLAEKFESAITSGIEASESHVYSISNPGMQAVHRISKTDDRWISSCPQGNLEGISIGDNSKEVIKVCKARRDEIDKDS
jgi:hypothetical protein